MGYKGTKKSESTRRLAFALGKGAKLEDELGNVSSLVSHLQVNREFFAFGVSTLESPRIPPFLYSY